MGSRSLQRSGHHVLAYDARGHGASEAAADGEYGYPRLAADLGAVLDAAGFDRAVLAGASMGAQTAARYALEHPERVAGLILITPAYDPAEARSPAELARWDALARGLREGGVEGFVQAYDLDTVAESMRATVETVLRQRLSAHEHPGALAAAQRWAQWLGGARLLVEDGQSPLAWQGGRLSRLIAEVAADARM